MILMYEFVIKTVGVSDYNDLPNIRTAMNRGACFFVSGIDRGEKNLEITQATITLAHSLKLDVVAEGVETQEQRNILRSLGCEYGQRYVFSRPLDEQSVVTFLTEAREHEYAMKG